jgi:hypothetical protein
MSKAAVIAIIVVLAATLAFGVIIVPTMVHNLHILQRLGEKATTSVAQASKAVGGFTPDMRRLYQRGLLHIRGPVGRYTIGQVILGEKDREDEAPQRARDARALAQQRAAEAKENALAAASVRQLINRTNGTNAQYGEKLFTHAAMGVARCELTVDGDIYEGLSSQDKRIVLRIADMECVAAYRQPHGGDRNERQLPDDGLFIAIDDESGEEVDHDLWSRQ